MPVTRPGMHTNEASMNAPIKTREANQQVSRHLSTITYLRRIWSRVYGEEKRSWGSNECHKVARRRRATAVKLCGRWTTKERRRCCRNVGKIREEIERMNSTKHRFNPEINPIYIYICNKRNLISLIFLVEYYFNRIFLINYIFYNFPWGDTLK